MPYKRKKFTGLLPIVTLVTLSVASGSSYALDIDKSIEDALQFGDIGEAAAGSQGVKDSFVPRYPSPPAKKPAAGEKKPVSNAFKIKADINYRYENVNQDNVVVPANGLPQAKQPQTANANTIRTTLGILTPVYQGVQGFVEYAGVHALQSDYNNSPIRNSKPEYSVVTDPGYNELNQLWLAYTGIPDTMIKGGRQRLMFDDQRYVGNVPWRQLEFTYDGVLVENKSIKDLTVKAAYLGKQKSAHSTTADLNAPLLNINYKVGDYGNLVGYGYWINFTEKEFWGLSSQTYGIRFSGATPKFYEHYNLLYTAEWAAQRDYERNPNSYEADRIYLIGGFQAYNFTFKAAVEQLGGKGAGKTFFTPLGSNHAINGTADIFLAATPANGLRDVSGTISASFLENDSLQLAGIYHAFSDDTGEINYGNEWDFQAVKKFGKHYSVLAKYAYFDDKGNHFAANATDTQKVWVQGNINF